MMIRSNCYWFSCIIIIYFSFTFHTIASPTSYFCRHDQRDALLEFIDEFPIDESKADSKYKSIHDEWTSSWNKSSDCCVWKGVICDEKSGQVISLDLYETFLNGSLKTNSSLFRLQYLQNLDLMFCQLHGEIPSSLGNLFHLTSLTLTGNDLVGEIPASISNLSQLTSLELDFNDLTGEIPFSIGNLSHLVVLNLHNNHLVGEVPASIGNLNKLEVMALGRNFLSGNILILLANLTQLSEISLNSNNFTSPLPFNMSGFHDLKIFDVGGNSFQDSIPQSLFLLPSLQWVDLSGNQFTNPIEFASTSSSSKLQVLRLRNNRFHGPIPEHIFGFLSLLELDLSHNNFSGPIPTSISKLVNLTVINLSNNILEGKVPGCLWRLNTVMLSHNSFSSFEKSSNGLKLVPASIENLLRRLELSSNLFRERFPLWICNLKRLSILDLSDNLFGGSIPPCLRNLSNSIFQLYLHNNNFSGSFPEIFGNDSGLGYLDVSRNQLEGIFPKSLINCKSLHLVNMEGNKIKDTFPSWLGSLPVLEILILRSNKFFGPLYHRHMSVGFRSLVIIDISHNGFTGTLPPHYFSSWRKMATSTEGPYEYMSTMVSSDMNDFYLSMEMVNKGVEMSFERIVDDWRIINFSGNKIYGKIPRSVGLLKNLRLLNLSGNAFTSDIPQSLANMTKLETLDLSRNKLTGQIPQDLGKLSFLSYMNFSHNLLQGFVPRGTQFQRQNCSSFSDNPGLQGLKEICGETHFLNPTLQQPEEISETKEHIISWIAAAIACVPGVFCGLVIGHIFTSHNHEWFAETFGRRKFTSAR